MTTDTSSTPSTSPATPTPSAYPNPLGLTSVLPGSLPPSLGTLTAPDIYQVDAVFNRRPQSEEVTALHSPATQQTLSDAGYPSVTLRVSDRRLEIANTNLEELKSGLATFLADHLAAITAKIQRDRLNAHTRLAAAAEAERSRADAIAREAELITFEQTPAKP
ncbi:hypothetical protein QE410_000944 [Microbacterium sp. SORGH_AS 1204]|uniref:hypothetical protein n=1 Tax=Microbacterium sp. SORGH_AS_1204 TaxID=3041785 RepID=UPI00278E8D6C|nr:hypothetical protein [Microbacterium sp. SORGH_AS_1204]MDQ1136145.1 hypothetical protein [Microbacterium sp. SORGH_AS_1204]